MFASLRKAAFLILDPALFGVVVKSVVLTALLFVALFAALEYGLTQLPTLGSHWVNLFLEWTAPILLLFSVFFLGAPVAALFGSLYLDKVAGAVEARSYPADGKASGAPPLTALGAALRLAGLVLVADLALLPVDFELPGVGEIATILVNAWLLGREYYELAALRHVPRAAADALRARHIAAIFGGGLIISLLTVVPVADLFAPLFGSALMVHLFKRHAREEHP